MAAAEFIQTIVDEDDPETGILDAVAGGRPWAFLVARSDGPDGLGIEASVGGGIVDVALFRKLLTLALDALPDQP